MKIHRLLFPAALALLALAPGAGRAPSLVPGAGAYSVNAWDFEDEPQPNTLRDFLRAHGKLLFYGVAAALFILFTVMIGPPGGHYGYRFGFFHRGGFGSFGGFGGSTSMKNPWE